MRIFVCVIVEHLDTDLSTDWITNCYCRANCEKRGQYISVEWMKRILVVHLYIICRIHYLFYTVV